MTDQNLTLEDAAEEHISRESQIASGEVISRARPYLVSVLGVCMLVSVALYNGYPTIFSDTGSYLLTGAFFVAFEPFRAPIYSVFTRVTSLGISAWFTIVTQALIVVYVLREACQYLTGSYDRKLADLFLLADICILTALTSLPWLVSLLMPDVFAGVVFLSAFLSIFADELTLIRKILLAAIFMISVGAHTSLFPIAALFVVAVATLRFAGRPLQLACPKKISVLAWLLVPIIAAGLWTAKLNSEMDLGFRLSPSRNMFLLARLFSDGLAKDFLRENCPNRPFISCRYLSNLPQTAEQFLFWHPLLGDLTGHEDEMEIIVRGTIFAYPLKFATNSAKDTLLQLASLPTGDEIRTFGAAQWNNSAIQQVFPGDFHAVSNARQFRGSLLRLADAAAAIDTAVFWISMVACLLFARTGRFERINMFLYSAIIFLVINASVCATFSGVYGRYQSRVAWIVPLCLTAYICCLAVEWKRDAVFRTAP